MNTHSGGYTMVEIMIFLAISGAMLTWSVLAIRARQQQVEFSQTVRDFENRLKDMANDIATGYYPNATGFECEVPGSTNANNSPRFNPAGAGQGAGGTNKDCIFLGKAIHLGVQDTDQQGYYVYTVLGRRQTPNPLSPGSFRDVLSFEEANPEPLLRTSGGSTFDYTQKQKLDWGVKFQAASSGLIGYFTTFAGNSNPNRGLDSGSLSTQAISIPTAGGTMFSLGLPESTAADAIRALQTPSGGFAEQAICLARGDDQEFALLTIGTGGRAAEIKTQFRGAANPAMTAAGISC